MFEETKKGCEAFVTAHAPIDIVTVVLPCRDYSGVNNNCQGESDNSGSYFPHLGPTKTSKTKHNMHMKQLQWPSGLKFPTILVTSHDFSLADAMHKCMKGTVLSAFRHVSLIITPLCLFLQPFIPFW